MNLSNPSNFFPILSNFLNYINKNNKFTQNIKFLIRHKSQKNFTYRITFIYKLVTSSRKALQSTILLFYWWRPTLPTPQSTDSIIKQNKYKKIKKILLENYYILLSIKTQNFPIHSSSSLKKKTKQVPNVGRLKVELRKRLEKTEINSIKIDNTINSI